MLHADPSHRIMTPLAARHQSRIRLTVGSVIATCLFVFAGCDRQPEQRSALQGIDRPAPEVKKSWVEKRSETSPSWKDPPLQHRFAVNSSPRENFRVVHYTSRDSEGGELKLLAWLAMPSATEWNRDVDDISGQPGKVPAIVYFHSGHELGASDCDEVRPFLDAGFAVMLPSVRGENGNRGHFELFWGEVDDGLAAVRWLAQQPEIDRDRIYTFGHSAGGGIAALLSLADADAPIRFGGSCGGLYRASNLRHWQPEPPFVPKGDIDFDLRTLAANTDSMNRKHFAYLGLADSLCENSSYVYSDQLQKRFVLGDHFSSLPIAVVDFGKQVFRDAFPNHDELPRSLRPLPWQHLADVPTQSVVPDHEAPKRWRVQADPTTEPLTFYAGPVRCEILMRDRNAASTDFVFPRGFQPVAKFHALGGAPKPGVTIIDLTTMLERPAYPGAVFPLLRRNSYSYSETGPDRFAFRWPGSNRPVDSKGVPGFTIPWGVFAASPGGRYVAAFSDQYELLVWDAKTEELVGRNPLPDLPERENQPDGSRGRFTPAELGFSPDGNEFAAVVGEIGNMYLINYHWESGAITAFFPTVTPWSGHRSVRYPNRYRLQFLENGHGWLVEYGHRIIDRKSGERRGAFAFTPQDERFYRMDTATFTVPRAISGNRVLAVIQDPVDLFHHQIQTVDLNVSK